MFEQGAAIVLSEHELTDPAGPYVLVESTTDAMKKLAAFYRKSLDIKVVGITGSVGKTSTKEMISSVLSRNTASTRPQAISTTRLACHSPFSESGKAIR